ncbi:MAG: hypothetical protein AB7O52_08915 [Planctomycetota bacterium]
MPRTFDRRCAELRGYALGRARLGTRRTRSPWAWFAVAGLALTLATASGSAQSAPSPTHSAADSVNRAITALGGVEAYRKAMNAQLTCQVKTTAPQEGLTITTQIQIVSRADGARRLERDLAGRKHTLGTDGKVYWQRDPSGTVTELDAIARESLRMDHILQVILTEHDALGYTAELTPPDPSATKATPLGTQVTFVKKTSNPASPAPGDRVSFTFHPETGLPVRISYVSPDPWGGSPFSVTFEYTNYRTVDGARIAHSVRQLRDGKSAFEITVTAIAIGVVADDATFSKPPKS